MTQYITTIIGTKNTVNEQIKKLNDNGERIVNVLDYKEDYFSIKLTALVEKGDDNKC